MVGSSILIVKCTITIPWFDKTLHPNARVHYQVLAKAKDKAKHNAYYLALNYKEFVEAPIAVNLLFNAPDKRHRDLDGCLSACKAALDGIAQAIGVDDKYFRPITIDWGNGTKGTIDIILHQVIN